MKPRPMWPWEKVALKWWWDWQVHLLARRAMREYQDAHIEDLQRHADAEIAAQPEHRP